MESLYQIRHRYADLKDPKRIKALLEGLPAPQRAAAEVTGQVLAGLTVSETELEARRQLRLAEAITRLSQRRKNKLPGNPNTECRVLTVKGGIPIEGEDELLGRYIGGFTHASVVVPKFVQLEGGAKWGATYFEFIDGLPLGQIWMYAEYYIPGSTEQPQIEWVVQGPAGAVVPNHEVRKTVPYGGTLFSGIDMEWTVKIEKVPVSLWAYTYKRDNLPSLGLTMLGLFEV